MEPHRIPRRNRLQSLAAGLLCLLYSSYAAAAEPARGDSERLLAVGKLWVTIRYFHPYLAYRNIDWDKALIDALPQIRGANTQASFRSALQSMVDVLHDPSTYIRIQGDAESQSPISLNYKLLPDDTLVVSNSVSDGGPIPLPKELERLRSALDTPHRTVVFDQRLKERNAIDLLGVCLRNPAIANRLVSSRIEGPGQRTWIHSGLAPITGANPGRFHSVFSVSAGDSFEPISGSQQRNIRFLLGESSTLTSIASALLQSGAATVLTESPRYSVDGAETINLPLGDQVEAVISLSELVFANGSGLRAIPLLKDLTLTSLAQIPLQTSTPTLLAYPLDRSDTANGSDSYPSVARRILAAFKVWGSFRYFFAYRDLMDEDWDDVFSLFLPVLTSAKNAREYHLAVAEMVSHVSDSQAVVESSTLATYFGVAPVALRLQLIDGKPTVTQILNQEARDAGVAVGDIVTKVDSEDAAVRAKRLVRYISFSTQQWLGVRLMQVLLNGPDQSMAAITVLDRSGNLHDVHLQRSLSNVALFDHQREGEVTRLLPGNIGYVDLDRLSLAGIDAMFQRFETARAIIFDLRGSCADTLGLIASRLTSEENTAAAIYTGPYVSEPDLQTNGRLTQTHSFFFVQAIPHSSKPHYKGVTVALIDGRTMAEAEQTGLFLEAANKTVFVGSPSAGADGDTTNFEVPGGIRISFSGSDVRHGNTGKLQRVGIQTNVSATSTLGGIRNDRDEVLEKAIEYLSHSNAVAAGLE